MVQGWTASLRDDSPVLVVWQACVSQLTPGLLRPVHGVFPCVAKGLWSVAKLVTDIHTFVNGIIWTVAKVFHHMPVTAVLTVTWGSAIPKGVGHGR